MVLQTKLNIFGCQYMAQIQKVLEHLRLYVTMLDTASSGHHGRENRFEQNIETWANTASILSNVQRYHKVLT